MKEKLALRDNENLMSKQTKDRAASRPFSADDWRDRCPDNNLTAISCE